ncbi:TetR/AcrR family transcriptional regulator [Phyllobacterium sp. 628]|uniref:TetR/AcrR family transcriptional regulator n=1 Tax=Phyllobacterium sp. 628 TaxID=2718938 RepID=UPI0016624938|nr:TetR/AcrR family transcriptional regulator [Phyllobacterium sp. 628]QND51664.1 TetR/AcrR family transcriptional regulator [Phyllobacterium sp. 628]
MSEHIHESKIKLLDAAMLVIRTKGYAATRIEDVCEAAGLTKGSFFHHFKSKEDLAIATAQHFSAMADAGFAQAPYQSIADPLDRLLGYVDFRQAMVKGPFPDFTCLLGTMVQETYETHPAIRDACEAHISSHAHAVTADVAAAKAAYAPDAPFSADSLGLFTQAVVQGAFILAKARQNPDVAIECLSHLHTYLELLFSSQPVKDESYDKAENQKLPVV